MISKYSNIVENASDYVFNLLKEKLQGIFVYHNYSHTREVVEACKKIGSKMEVNESDMEILLLAAWFHDTGFTERSDNHEDVSIEIARKFLKDNNYSEERTEKILACINATRFPSSPKNLLEEILCDADLFHLGTKDYSDKSNLLRIEWEKSRNKNFTEEEWIKINIDFLSNHRFFTKYAAKNLEGPKNEKLIKLQKKYRNILEDIETEKKRNEKREFDKLKFEKKQEDVMSPERGIETMFRNTIRTHVEFSGMADSKANIMISINTLIIGAIVTVMIRKLDTNPQLILPTLLLTIVSLLCIIFAVIVTRPKITSGTFTKDDIRNKKTNLLFFGNFFNMSLEDFQWGMIEMMKDKEFLYGSMIKDFYYLGQVLGKKYKYLRICYSLFMYGLIASVIAYAIAFIATPVNNFNLLE